MPAPARRTHTAQKVGPYMHAAASTSRPPPPRKSKMVYTVKGQNGGTQNEQRYEVRVRGATHSQWESQHTQKYVTYRATLRNEQGESTMIKVHPKTCPRAHPPHARSHREQKEAKGMPVRACRRKRNKATTAEEKQDGMEGHEGSKSEEKDARREPHTAKRKNNTRKHKNTKIKRAAQREKHNAQSTKPRQPM